MDFCESDKELLRLAMEMIQGDQADALILRYWKNYEISEIAQQMKISWGDANRLINTAQREIKKILLDSPEFKGGRKC